METALALPGKVIHNGFQTSAPKAPSEPRQNNSEALSRGRILFEKQEEPSLLSESCQSVPKRLQLRSEL